MGRPFKWYEKFLIYGGLGWCVEILWTSIYSQIAGDGDISLRGYSYLYMIFIWGAGVLLLEWIEKHIRGRNLFVRGTIYALACFVVEFAAGMLLHLLTNRIPWDYSKASIFSIWGAIRLDYFPFWFLAGLASEKVCRFINRVRI